MRLLTPLAVGLLVWKVVPGIPREQTVIFALGEHSELVTQLDVQWESLESAHVGQLTLNFPVGAALPEGNPPSSPRGGARIPAALASRAPARIVRQFRLPDGEYSFQISARRHASIEGASNQRTEVTRRVTLDGNPLTLRLDELTR